MKKIIVGFLILCSLVSEGQIRISDMPIYTGASDSAYVPAVINGVNRKVFGVDLFRKRGDSLANAIGSLQVPVIDTTSLSNRISAIAGAADTSSLSARINTKPTLTTLAGLRAMTAPSVSQIYYTTDYPGNWKWNAASTVTDNTGLVIKATAVTTGRFERIVQGEYYAKWFQINGNGSTDVGAAVTAMISVVPSYSKIIFTDTNYITSSEIIVNKPLSIIGLGTVKFTQTTDYTNIFRATSADVNFNNITFQQTGKADQNSFPTGYGAGVVYYGVKAGEVLYCKFYNCGDNIAPLTASPRGGSKSGAGVYITRAYAGNVKDCEFYRCIQGINVDGYQNTVLGDAAHIDVKDNVANHNYFEDCFKAITWDFLDVSGGIGANPGKIIFNKITQTSNYVTAGTQGINIALNFCEKSLLVEGNDIDSVATGIGVIYGSFYTKIINNDLNYCYDGISLFTGAGRVVSDITVSGNTITRSRNSGVIGYAAQNVNLDNNFISLGKTGVLLQNFCFNINANNNQIFSNTYSGIQIDRATGVSIKNNKIYNNGTDAANGDSSGIIINKPNFGPTAVTAINIRNNDFDFGYASGPALVQTYAVKSVGTYYSYTSYASAGDIKNNYFGRCSFSESLSYGTGFHYSSNIPANFGSDTTVQSAMIVGADTANNYLASVGANGPVLVSHKTNTYFTFSPGVVSSNIRTNATIENSNFATVTGTGGSTTIVPELQIGNATTTAYRNLMRGSSPVAPGSAQSYASLLMGVDSAIINAGGDKLFTRLAIRPISLNTASGGTLARSASLYIANSATGATNDYSILVDTGRTRLNGSFELPNAAGVATTMDSAIARNATTFALEMRKLPAFALLANPIFTGGVGIGTATTASTPLQITQTLATYLGGIQLDISGGNRGSLWLTTTELNLTKTTSPLGIHLNDVGRLKVDGGLQTAFIAKTAAFTLTTANSTVTGDATSAAFNLTLPTAVGITGTVYTLKKIDASANAVTVNTTSSQTIDASTTYSLATQWKYVTVQSNGANWIIIGNN